MNRYSSTTHFWGGINDYHELRDLDRDGRPEFLAEDWRFGQISSTAQSGDPVQIWAFAAGRMRDVTRRFPEVIERDARELWRIYRAQSHKPRATRWVREPLGAWVAEQYLLGRSKRADRVLVSALRSGELDLPPSRHAVSSRAFVAGLQAFLRRVRYSRG